jgi:hypothetical protein
VITLIFLTTLFKDSNKECESFETYFLKKWELKLNHFAIMSSQKFSDTVD